MMKKATGKKKPNVVISTRTAAFIILVTFILFSLWSQYYQSSYIKDTIVNLNMNPNILPILPIIPNISEELQFFVQHTPREVGCGGCDVLGELIKSLEELGFYVQAIPMGRGICPKPAIVRPFSPIGLLLPSAGYSPSQV